MTENGNWLSHGFKKAPSLFEAQTALGWGVVVTLLALVGVLYLVQGSQIIISGYQMQRMTAELKELQEINTQLESQIASARSAAELQSEAQRLGFRPAGPDDIEYLPVEGYPQLPGDNPLVAAVHSTLPENESQPIRWLQGFNRAFHGWTHATAGGEN